MVNIQSMRKNFNNELLKITETGIEFDVLVFTEVWIKLHEKDLYHIADYNSMLCDSNKSSAGGVMVFYKTSLNLKKEKSILTENCEAVQILLELSAQNSLCITAIYRSPNPRLSKINKFIEEDISKICENSKAANNHLFLGDINIDVLGKNMNKNRCTKQKYLNVMSSNGYSQALDEITRLESSTCIDHLFTAFKTIEVPKTSLIQRTDHCALIVELKYSDSKPPQRSAVEYKIKYDRAKFKSLVYNHDWSDYFQIPEADRALNYLVDTCRELQESVKKKLKPQDSTG